MYGLFPDEIPKDDQMTVLRKKVEAFLHQSGLTRIIRREICFGLIPKTLKRKFPETRPMRGRPKVPALFSFPPKSYSPHGSVRAH